MQMQTQNEETVQRTPDVYFGFDLSKDTFTVSWRPVGGPPVQISDIRKMATHDFPRTRKGVEQWWKTASKQLAPGQIAGVVMEVTSSYSLEVLAWLFDVCPEVVATVVPGKRTRDYANCLGLENKTDDIDARVLACFGCERQPARSIPRSDLHVKLRALLRTRLVLVEDLVASRQRLTEAKREHLDAKTSKLLECSLSKVIRVIETQIAKLEEEAKKLIAQDEQLSADIKALDKMTGVGWHTAATVLAEFGDLRLFGRRGEIVAMAGLNPVVRKSGKSVESRPRISKKGNKRVRRALYLAAISVIGGQNMFATMYNGFVSRGKKKMVAVVAVMRKMLLVMRSILISGEDFDPHYDQKTQTETPQPAV